VRDEGGGGGQGSYGAKPPLTLLILRLFALLLILRLFALLLILLLFALLLILLLFALLLPTAPHCIGAQVPSSQGQPRAPKVEM